MNNIVPTSQGSHYSDEERNQAAIEWSVLGNMAQVSRNLGIPESTLCTWKQTDWWVAQVEELRTAKADEIRAKYVAIVQASQDQVIEELPNATAQQAATVGAIAFDKIRLQDNAPTTIRGTSSSLKELSDAFKAEFERYRSENVVSVQEKE